MDPRCPTHEHVSRRALLKGLVVASGGAALANWGGLFNSRTIAAEARRQGKRCILLWMSGGASHLDTFDMKPGRAISGPFRPIGTNVPGIQVCQYLPRIAKQADKLAVIRSMSTADADHAGGTYLMHCGYPREPGFTHPELGAVCAKYLGDAGADLPQFIQVGQDGGESTPNSGAGFLGSAAAPLRLGRSGDRPENTTLPVEASQEQRRSELLDFLDQSLPPEQQSRETKAYRSAREASVRLLRAKDVFNLDTEWDKYRDLYGESRFGKHCLLARRLVETGVPFVEVEQPNYDSHSDNFEWHKALLPVLDHAWSGLLVDLESRGLLKDTLVVWMGEFGRTPDINNRAGRDHYAKAWTVVLAGGGARGGVVHGATDADGAEVTDGKVTQGDLFATIYTLLGVDPRARHFVGTRPIWATPEEAAAVKAVMA